MIIYPAIDLKDGVCVRLLRGDMDRATIFNTDPARQALDFQESGFQWLHLVDLNGAIEGRSINTDVVTNVIQSVDIPVQLGGGIRTMKALEHWFSTGVSRAVLGTAALADPDFVQAACREFEGRVVVAIDARDGRVAIDGWTKDSGVRVLDLALRFEDCGAAAILYTDINRDGAMNGVNVDATVDLAFAVTTPVIASGGVSSLRDLRELKDHEDVGINGVIIGRALYDGRIDPVAAIKAAAG
ncbi:MAG: 1-(5-phosphoribosyl)-5-[(5-phosphoribosylamino)methylideneamino]imidazole-4-carboxamide isomerase [Proteobacteria bacterium]|nr:1-(5-phosphoribosyl)-5-[(5-phosphoribosylamino)methylideneamino]imidazole-4-carboxamide isomerase [Pseudomonadota bacterium]MDA1323192.1 1-(5-phosphoribosyl)-5-[(5-phosphoribosylamino)methylideneamino]imidazole-4-carboxamide isomerase [Pseudomonadota bacterium]